MCIYTHGQGICQIHCELNDMQSTGETIPAPISVKHYSGKFMVRIPPEVYRKRAILAAVPGASLNRLA